MKVTFKNRLNIVKNYEGMPRIAFDHEVACDLKMFIEKTKPVKNGEKAPEIDWKITIEGGNDALINQHRKDLSASFMRYIKSRTRQPANKLIYKQLESLAGIRSI